VAAKTNNYRHRRHTTPFEESWTWLATGATWSIVSVEAEIESDYPERNDLFLATSMYSEVLVATFGGQPFYSERHSRCGESFVYVKLDDDGVADKARLDIRSARQDALNVALQDNERGCVIGGGTGHRYSYIDLALTDLPKSLEIVRDTLRRLNVPRRSWIQFLDSNLCGEWIGIQDDTPAPPTADVRVGA
jgi:hypothetical protein